MAKTNSITIQSNEITTARYYLGLYEKKVLNAIIQNVSADICVASKNKVKALDYWIDKNDHTAAMMIFKAGDIARPDKFNELRAALEKLRSQTVVLEYARGTRITGFLNWAVLPPNSSTIELCVDIEFYRQLFNLTGGYTIFQSTVINSLTSIHAVKLYEYLARWRDKNIHTVEIKELRRLTNTTNKYSRYNDFKKSVLETAQKQLNNNKLTDIKFEFEEIKDRGKEIDKIKFTIIKTEHAHEIQKERNKYSPNWDFTQGLVENAKRYGINLKGKTFDLFNEYKNMFGEAELSNDLFSFFEVAKSKGKGIPYVIGCLKNKILDNSQIKIEYPKPTPPKRTVFEIPKAMDIAGFLDSLKK